MSYIITYIIGMIVAFYLIAKHISRNNQNEMECSGFILGYAFSLFSWVAVVIALIAEFRYKLEQGNSLNIPEKDLHID